jgi:hypothetical protein
MCFVAPLSIIHSFSFQGLMCVFGVDMHCVLDAGRPLAATKRTVSHVKKVFFSGVFAFAASGTVRFQGGMAGPASFSKTWT